MLMSLTRPNLMLTYWKEIINIYIYKIKTLKIMTEHIVYMDNIEDLIISKYLIESKLIEKKELTKKLELTDFVGKFINMSRNVVAYNINSVDQVVVPFFVYTLDDDRYIFFVSKNEKTELTLMKLKSINYDVTKLNNYNGGNTMLRVEDNSYEF